MKFRGMSNARSEAFLGYVRFLRNNRIRKGRVDTGEKVQHRQILTIAVGYKTTQVDTLIS